MIVEWLVRQVKQVKQEGEGRLGQMVTLEALVLWDHPARLVYLGQQVQLEILDKWEYREFQGLLLMEKLLLEIRVRSVIQGQPELLETQVEEVQLVCLEVVEKQEHPERSEQQGLLEILDPLV